MECEKQTRNIAHHLCNRVLGVSRKSEKQQRRSEDQADEAEKETTDKRMGWEKESEK